MTQSLMNLTQGKVMARKVRYCDRLFSRMKGLLTTQTPDAHLACWIVPCNSVHSFGMKYAIDVFFLNHENKIVKILRDFKPNRMSPIVMNAHSVVEFSTDANCESEIGDVFSLRGES